MVMPPRVLIVAEDQVVRASLARVFEQADYIVLAAREEEEGRDLFQGASIDLVILDANEGWRSSARAIRRLKELNPFVPVILLRNKTERAPEPLLADAVVAKPVDIAELARKAGEFVREPSGARLARVCGDDELCRQASGFYAPLLSAADDRGHESR